MAKISYYTKEGFERLKAELDQLKSEERPSIARQIAEAREKGDLSENAEYDAAKEAQGLLELRISQLEEVMANARVLDTKDLDTSEVRILSTVKVKQVKSGKTISYTIVSEEEADLKQKKISASSPIGKGLLGKKIGDIAKIEVPRGIMEFEVLDITIEL